MIDSLDCTNQIIDLILANIYWKDKTGYYLGCNQNVVKMAGVKSKADIIGKTDYDLPWKEAADDLKKIDQCVLENGYYKVEEYPIIDNKKYSFLTVKTTLLDNAGKVIGIIGVSTDITLQKEKEQLELENVLHKIASETQAKFRESVGRLAHDIKSPLDSLHNIIRHTACLSETQRITLQSISSGISKIAQNLLDKYMDKEVMASDTQQEIIVQLTLEQIMQEKIYQFCDQPIKFKCTFKSDTNPICIMHNASTFKRMLSNLLDNAVESVIDNSRDNNPLISLNMDYDGCWVHVSVSDNGIGMDKILQNKILQNVPFTEGKAHGHGIGFGQIHEAVTTGKGKLAIDSEAEHGTTITVSFPRIKLPKWLLQEIKIGIKDIVVILDDDDSIHYLWENKLKHSITHQVKIMRFRSPERLYEYINGLSKAVKEKILLLTDYELDNHGLTGIDIIQQHKIKQAVLVTNYYNDYGILSKANGVKIKVLPKPLANSLKITLEHNKIYKYEANEDDIADLIFLEPNGSSTRLILALFSDKVIHHYTNATELLDNIKKYPKNVKICFADDLGDITGIELGAKLYGMGYNKLALFSSAWSGKHNLPPYIQHIDQYGLESFSKYLLGDSLC